MTLSEAAITALFALALYMSDRVITGYVQCGAAQSCPVSAR